MRLALIREYMRVSRKVDQVTVIEVCRSSFPLGEDQKDKGHSRYIASGFSLCRVIVCSISEAGEGAC